MKSQYKTLLYDIMLYCKYNERRRQHDRPSHCCPVATQSDVPCPRHNATLECAVLPSRSHHRFLHLLPDSRHAEEIRRPNFGQRRFQRPLNTECSLAHSLVYIKYCTVLWHMRPNIRNYYLHLVEICTLTSTSSSFKCFATWVAYSLSYSPSNHRLNGSSSRVLTAASRSYGKAKRYV